MRWSVSQQPCRSLDAVVNPFSFHVVVMRTGWKESLPGSSCASSSENSRTGVVQFAWEMHKVIARRFGTLRLRACGWRMRKTCLPPDTVYNYSHRDSCQEQSKWMN